MTIDQFAEKYKISYSTVVTALNQLNVKSIGTVDNGRSHKKMFNEADMLKAVLRYYDAHRNLALKKAEKWKEKADAAIRIHNDSITQEGSGTCA